MGRKSPCSGEFWKYAVALYRASDGERTYAAVAADLGITGETLRTWVRKDTGRPVPGPPDDTALSPAEELTRLRAGNQRLLKAEEEWQSEREIVRRAAATFARGVKRAPNRWDFICDDRAVFGVQRICQVLDLSRSGDYPYRATAQARAARQAGQAATAAEIRQIHAEHHGARQRGSADPCRTPSPGLGDQPQAGRPAEACQPHGRPQSSPQEADHDRRQDGPARTGPGDA
ncbi:hypothetical protein [Streptomyces sp. NPDC006285]|uniref:hypothetical protein n=1 Tax=Streptomyces sp. NPDC006285 TaxID=3364742 RepID=UPI0036B5097A